MLRPTAHPSAVGAEWIGNPRSIRSRGEEVSTIERYSDCRKLGNVIGVGRVSLS